MPEKGVCLARSTGELHPGPSGWRDLNSEVLELLTFWRAEHRRLTALWRPYKICTIFYKILLTKAVFFVIIYIVKK